MTHDEAMDQLTILSNDWSRLTEGEREALNVILGAPTVVAGDLREFALQVARLNIAGDIRDMGVAGEDRLDEYSPDGNDDEIDALYGLIREARELTGSQPDNLVPEEEAERCADCQEWFRKDLLFKDGNCGECTDGEAKNA